MTQQEALNILKTGKNVFLTGAAGSGKTHVLNRYIEYLRDEGINVAITASTGIAATHMNGQTIHSWSGIGIRETLTENDIEKVINKRGVGARIRRASVLIIDEVSMLHDHQLDLVDMVCKAAREDDRPFGGLQVVLCGDFFQLPPVARGRVARFIVESDAWHSLNPMICYLQEQHRHKDENLLKVLNSIRRNGPIEDIRNILKSRLNVNLSGKDNIAKLYTHNADVDNINERKLASIDGVEKKFIARTEGRKSDAEALKRSCLAPEELKLKKGASVMFVKNNFDEGYVNGTLGSVVDFNDIGYPIVKTFSGETIEVGFESWSIEEDGKLRATLRQIPLRLAWAITIHKSQGMSLDAAEMDLSKTFEKGMGYVALSRVRSMEGMRLLGMNDLALRVKDEVLEMDAVLMKKSEDILVALQRIPAENIENKHDAFRKEASTGSNSSNKKNTYEKTRELLDKGLSINEIAGRRDLTEGTVLGHLEKLVQKYKNLNIEHLRPGKNKLSTIEKAFKEFGAKEGKLTPVFKGLDGRISYEELRLARLFIQI